MKRLATSKTLKKKVVKASSSVGVGCTTAVTNVRSKKIYREVQSKNNVVMAKATTEVIVPRSLKSPFSARVAALVLVSYFLLVPFADAYAATEASTAAAVPAADSASAASGTSQPSDITTPVTIPNTTPTAVVSTAVGATDATQTPATLVTDVTTPTSTTIPDSTTTPTTPAVSPANTATSTDASTTPSASPTRPVVATTTPILPLVVSTSTPVVTASTTPKVTIPATTTGAAEANGPLVVSHTTDADKMSFSAGECVIVGNGTFQCTHSHASSTASHTDGVYAARDSAGVMQIYYQHNDVTDTITATTYDNDAPAIDSVNGDIVWHALLDDRYQIMRYEHASGHITKLTSGTVNSMLPASYDGAVVYQTWQGNNWDIAMIDKDGTSHMLTTNDVHDVAPSITDRYITWQSRENNEWVAKVYDRVSGTTQTVHGTEGSKVENPRMVLVFDAKKENGDVETVGYDVSHNHVVPLSATPAPLPKDIPQPAHQKNDQAFVQSTSTIKIETKTVSDTPNGTGSTGTSTPPTGDASSTPPSSPPVPVVMVTGGTSTISQATTTTPAISEGASSTPIVNTISATATISVIPDLVIEPYHATDTATTSNIQ